MIQTTEISRNVHIMDLPKNETDCKLLLMSDLHWDNPKCERKLLKKHLDEAKEKNAKVIINGDFFCLMQGKGDPRRNKDDIRDEHNNAKYLDSIIKTAVEWFEPYAEIIELITYGNHETGIIKHQETDVLERFVERLNTVANPKNKVNVGGYSGWFIVRHSRKNKTKSPTKVYKIKYHHGYGGGGPVTKGTIQHQREMNKVQGADMLWMGHVHEDYEMTYTYEYLDHQNNVKHKDVCMLRTASYKEEYQDGYGGFHIERGRPVKPMGGRWLDLKFGRSENGGTVVKPLTYKTLI